jgi:hypothetical protein
MQYTLRNVPASVDSLLRRRARQEGKSLNEAAIEALVRGLGLAGAPTKRRDISDIAGSWHADKATDDALEEQRSVDRDLWK